jgi:hypothetical protein
MSAFARSTEPCPSCGAEAPARARFCPECGAGLDGDSGTTVPEHVTLHETPPTYRQAEPRWFGVAPPELLLGVSFVLLVFALVLFATGSWPFGLILLGVGALLLAAFIEAARRRPGHGLSGRSFQARERAQSALETWRVRSVAAAETKQVRYSLALLDTERRGLLHDLGAAVHGHNDGAEATIRARLEEIGAQEAELHQHYDRTLGEAGERIRKARLPVEETMMVSPTEPTPPPGEATPPQPAIVPEPYPPPDEATPPTPAPVPEPSPNPDEK